METRRLEELKKHLGSMYEWHDRKINWFNYLHNHLNGFQLMKRTWHKLQKIEDLMDNEQSIKALEKVDKNNGTITDNYINLVYQGIRRVQKFYAIPASDMAAGRRDDQIIGDPMNSCECYVISNNCYERYDYYGSMDWAVQTHDKWTIDGRPKCVNIKKLHHQMIISSMHTGFNLTTVINSSELYNSETDATKFIQNAFLMNNEMQVFNKSKCNTTFDIFNSYNILEFKDHEDKHKYLCRVGYQHQTRILTNDSKCRYQTNNVSYRILMPFKEEDINSNPSIKMYHDVIYDDEIEKIKIIARQNFQDGTVVSLGKGTSLETIRSGQVSWIYKYMEKEQNLDSLDVRIQSFTGRYTESAESYQVVNYGLGGHYIPHHDPLPNRTYSRTYGQRIATVLFYLTDVENGGFTTFPTLDIICPPEKGAALVFYSLNLTDGSLLYDSLHGSCSILKGNKFIFTRWLREEGQHLTYKWKDRNTFAY
ncbi:Hypothetical protein CINCED_3A015630 [Cinara cedri]|nr:Hypothetical protein CINCED_3A015630 [Cinara cedri]